jgi:hypothetical protein
VAKANWNASEIADKIQQYSLYIDTNAPQRQKASSQVAETLVELKKQGELLHNRIEKAKQELGYLKPSSLPTYLRANPAVSPKSAIQPLFYPIRFPL